jgi:5-oxoprolinase (ATP-hydrolysing) subunit A
VGTSRLADDISILDVVSSASIACGYHAGDATSMRETVRAARDRGVAIGAHVSYPDIPGFGRRELGLDTSEIARHVRVQIEALSAVCAVEKARVRYVKPHGALYNRAANDPAAASAVARAIGEFGPKLALLGLAGSEMARAAANAGVRFASEAFVDRAYTAQLTLVPRDQPGAIIDDVEKAVDRAVALVQKRIITTAGGAVLPLEAESLCVHGDGRNALDLVRALRAGLESSGARIAPFAA